MKIKLLSVFFAAFALQGEESPVAARPTAVSWAKIPDKIEWVQSLARVHTDEHGRKWSTGINYVDISHQFGKIAGDGYVYGFHHGTVGAITLTIPFKVKELVLAPGILAVFGPNETGPGFGARWQFAKGFFSTEGTVGAFHPVGGKKLQFIGDPIDADIYLFRSWTQNKWVHDFRVGYSGEFGVYGPLGKFVDQIHGGQVKMGPKHPVSLWISRKITHRETEVISSYVPDGKIFRVGFSFNPRKH